MSNNRVFLKALGNVESGNRPSAMNPESSATGEIQMMWSQWGDKIKKFSGNPNLTREDYANDPDLQNKWADYYVNTVLTPESEKLQKRFPQQLKQRGLTDPEDIKTLLHFQGYPRSSQYLRKGQELKTKEKNLPIKEYLKRAKQKREELKIPTKETPVIPPQDIGMPITENKEEPSLWEKGTKAVSDILFPAAYASGGESIKSLPRAVPELPDDEIIPEGFTREEWQEAKGQEELKQAEIKGAAGVEALEQKQAKEEQFARDQAKAFNRPFTETQYVKKQEAEKQTQANINKQIDTASKLEQYGERPPGFESDEEWIAANEAESERKRVAEEAAVEAKKMSKPEVIGRAAIQGVTFDFADELEAAVKSVFTGKPYKTTVEEARIPYRRAAEERPGLYYGTAITTGALSSFIPVYGWAGRSAEIANAARIAKEAGTAAARTKVIGETVKGATQVGAITAAGATEKSITEQPLEFAREVGAGAAISGATGALLGKASDFISNDPKIQSGLSKIGKVAKETVEQIIGKSQKWQVPEFAGRPDKQRIVNQIVKEGMSAQLTDQQIANNIGLQFNELSPETLQKIVNPPGLRENIRQRIAGSKAATEFLDRPEQLERAERISERGEQTTEMARAKADIALAEQTVEQTKNRRQQVMQVGEKLITDQEKKLQDLERRYKLETNTVRKAAIQRERDAARIEISAAKDTLLKQRKIDQLESIIEDNQKIVNTGLDAVKRSRTTEHLQQVQGIADNLEGQAQNLASQRTKIINSLAQEESTPDMIAAFQSVRDSVDAQISKNGMEDIRDKFFEYAFKGDPRARKISRHIDALESNAKNIKIKEENAKIAAANKGKPVEQQQPLRELIPINEEDLVAPSTKDVVEALFIANKKISSPESGNPAANIKRELSEIVQEHMRLVNEDVYITQRALAKVKSQLQTLYTDSGLYRSRYVPKVGKTGRITAVKTPFIKKDIPDFTQVSEKYTGVLEEIGVPVADMKTTATLKPTAKTQNAEQAQILEQMGFGRGVEPVGQARQKITQSTQEISQLESQITQLDDLITNLKASSRTGKIEDRAKKQALLEDLTTKKNQITDYIARKKLQQGRIEKQYLTPAEEAATAQVESAKAKQATLAETERGLRQTYGELTDQPVTARDVGQAGVVAAQKGIPYNILKVVVPSPQTRIKAYNAIKRNFANPSLNAAVRMALEKPVTLSVVRGLAEMHKISEPALIDTLEKSGVVIESEE